MSIKNENLFYLNWNLLQKNKLTLGFSFTTDTRTHSMYMLSQWILGLQDINLPFYRLATNRVPFVSELTEHVVQFLVVILK